MKKPAIQFEYEKTGQRPDVVNSCPNCGELSASHFQVCPLCKHMPMKRKIIHFTIADLREKHYPVLVVSKSELKNRFVSGAKVDQMTDEDLLETAERIGERVLFKDPEIYLKVTSKI